MMRTLYRPAAASLLATLVVLGTLAVASASTPAGGPIQIYAPQNNDGIHGTIVITGAIGGYGKTLTINRFGKPVSNGNYVKITLQKGTFEINSKAFNVKAENLQPTVYNTTCSAVGTVTGPVTLYSGTGLYKGITGSVDITASFGFIGPRYKIGKDKGQCNLSNNAQPVSQYTSIVGTGTISF